MGLDITAWEKAVLTDRSLGSLSDDDWASGDLVHVFVYKGMEHSLRGLENDRIYEVSGKCFQFRAGSYSGYGQVRANLSHAALGVPPEEVWADPAYAEKPFYELIHFADNEGTIGPEAAADLAADFEEGRDTVRPKLNEWDQLRYDEWDKAFHLAAGHGLVQFG